MAFLRLQDPGESRTNSSLIGSVIAMKSPVFFIPASVESAAFAPHPAVLSQLHMATS